MTKTKLTNISLTDLDLVVIGVAANEGSRYTDVGREQVHIPPGQCVILDRQVSCLVSADRARDLRIDRIL